MLLFTWLTSEAVIVPLTLMSLRKLLESTVVPTCDFVCATSDAFTARLALVSPESMTALAAVSGSV